MFDTELKKQAIKEKKMKNSKMEKSVLYLRWLIIVFVFPALYITSNKPVSSFVYTETVAVIIIYNVLVTLHTLRSFKSEEKNSGLLNLILFIDILSLSIFSYQLGGITSDIYILYIFLIAYNGISKEISFAFKVAIFSVVIYSFFCIYIVNGVQVEFLYLKLALKDFFMLLTVYGTYLIKCEVKKFDEMHKKEFRMARTDKLTGLANRHYFDQKLSDEICYADSTGSPLNILIFDIDNFKKFNDTYGHVWGDKLLTLFSDIVKQNIRKSDIPVRYGGEEFLIVIRDLDLEMAKSVGERIRKQLEKQRIYSGNEESKRKVTVSCGLAQYPRHSKTIKDVIEYADIALYHAKELGKNIVVRYDEIGKIKHTVQMDIDTYMKK